jgi:hypothetical protein
VGRGGRGTLRLLDEKRPGTASLLWSSKLSEPMLNFVSMISSTTAIFNDPIVRRFDVSSVGHSP